MSIQGVPVPESAWKVPKFTFHLIKSVAVTQTRTYRFCWFSGKLCESAILNFFSYLHCSAILSYCAPSTDTAIIDVLTASQIAHILVAMWYVHIRLPLVICSTQLTCGVFLPIHYNRSKLLQTFFLSMPASPLLIVHSLNL